MTKVIICDYRDRMAKKNAANPAQTLLDASLAAQSQLVSGQNGTVIPAIAESPIPVLADKNRTPNPLLSPRQNPAKANA